MEKNTNKRTVAIYQCILDAAGLAQGIKHIVIREDNKIVHNGYTDMRSPAVELENPNIKHTFRFKKDNRKKENNTTKS